MLFLLCCIVSAWPAAGRTGPPDSPVSSWTLLPGLTAEIQPDGILVIKGEAQEEPLLTAKVPLSQDDPRRRRFSSSPEFFRDVLTEGVTGGQRGFSARADDDDDGLVDEDPRDGKDNDGDGLVDEDFAAIGDVMTVVHRQEGASSVHQEFYHWSYPGLRSAVFLALESDRVDLVSLEVTTGSADWVEADISALHHSVAGRPLSWRNHAFVTQVEGSGTGRLWLGMMILGDRPGYLVEAAADGRQLAFPLSPAALPVVLCAAESWSQLTAILAESDMVYRGVTDPVSRQTAGWMAPPSCSLCRTAGMPGFSWRYEGEGRLVLKMHLQPGLSPLVDPDLFTLQGVALGSPDEIRWLPRSGKARILPWSEVTLADLWRGIEPPSVPYAEIEALKGHKADGMIEYRFSGVTLPAGMETDTLTGSWLDGRTFKTGILPPGKPELTAFPREGVLAGPGQVKAMPSQVMDAGQILSADRHPPTLSPQLLEGWPTPFRDAISIKFRVPQTVGEAFVWVDQADVPKNLDRQEAVPWQGGSPSVSVKIYNINGQELVTLYSGSMAGGEYTVSWDGSDIFGRQVASGTYFCKLQLDKWSVTRRIVFLR